MMIVVLVLVVETMISWLDTETMFFFLIIVIIIVITIPTKKREIDLFLYLEFSEYVLVYVIV